MSAPPDAELLAEALRAQQAGQSALAAALCRVVLARAPRQPQASLLLGLILGRDDADVGAPLLADYLDQFPDDAMAASNLGMLRQRQGDAAGALALFERALARRPDVAAAHHGRGLALHKLGRLDDAAAAFERAVALGATDAVTRNNLGDLRRSQGLLDAALAAFDAAIAADATLAMAHVNRGIVLAKLGRPADAVGALRRALALDPGLVAAELELAEALEAVRLPDEARRHRAAAYRRQPAIVEPCTGERAEAAVLLLCSADRRDVSARFLIDGKRFAKTHLFLLRPDDGGPHAPAVLDGLPPVDLVFNTIADPDLGAPYFAEVAALAARTGRTMLNPPDRLPATRRDRLAATLAGIAGVLVPTTRRIARNALGLLPLDRPTLVRPVGDHGGAALARVDDAASLGAYLLKTPADDFYLTDFCDFRSADGHYRKYRLIFVDRRPYPYHLAIGQDWKLHYWRIEDAVAPWMKQEEEAFLADWSSVFSGTRAAAVRTVAARLDLDYGGIDCGFMPDGRVVVFEANANMLVHLNDPVEAFPYKHRHVPRIFDAMADLVRRRIG
ncbi:MAG: tetratricopeptide repeat protein [Proteobacteria bacterium]|nr:tetratricopeptide repeat protein [Pseudomonadota bacterium]